MKRVSINATSLASKKGVHNLTSEEDQDQDFFDGPEHPTLPSIFNYFVGAKRNSSRPITIINQANQDVLQFKEENFGLGKQKTEELLAIPVLPADEMENLTSEIKLWHSKVKRVRMIFAVAFFSGLTLVLITSAFSIYREWLDIDDSDDNAGNTYLDIHMCSQSINLLCMVVGTMLFRILPYTEMKKVVMMHALVFQFAFLVCAIANFHAVINHKIYVKHEEHFYTLHSWIGWMGIVAFVISLITGWIFSYYPNANLRAHHAVYGKASFMLVATASLVGYYHRSMKVNFGYDNRTFEFISKMLVNSVGILILVLTIFVRIGAANFSFRRQPKPQWDVIVFRSTHDIEEIFIAVHDRYESFELWINQINQTKLAIIQADNPEKPKE